ncbi:MAG: hypothetical protein F6K61_11150 [Sphaerospermopsis sp. SIO1G1]|nr:hypothetical protein [Sphaerospermopsis sp. SIO1G1]
MNVYYLLGWHGNLNAGDDAFAIVTAWGLRKYAQANSIIMEADSSKLLYKKHNIKLIQHPQFRIPGLSRLRRKYYSSIAKSFIYAGGTLFTANQVDLILKQKITKDTKTPRLALGVSAGPFVSSQHEKKTLEVFKSMNYVSFRDDFSYQWAKASDLDISYTQAFDMAILLPRILLECKEKKETQNLDKPPTIGISLLGFNILKNKNNWKQDLKWIRNFAETTHEVALGKNFKIILYSFCRHPWYNDDLACEAFLDAILSNNINKNNCEIELFKHNGDATRILSDMKRCSHIISMRLHGCIFAYTNQTPLLMLNYHAKCRDFGKTVGLDEQFCLDLSPFDIKSYKNTLNNFLETKSIATTLPYKRALEKAMLNFEGYDNWI